jgi:hypothetical protein
VSWDVGVFRFDEYPVPADGDIGGARRLPLGTAEDIRKSISRYLPETDWSDPTWGRFAGEGFLMEIGVGGADTSDDEQIDHISLYLRGNISASIPIMLSFAEPNRWTLIEVSEGHVLNNPTPL